MPLPNMPVASVVAPAASVLTSQLPPGCCLMCSIVLAGLLAGGILRADPQAMKEWQEIQTQFQPPDDFRMKASSC